MSRRTPENPSIANFLHDGNVCTDCMVGQRGRKKTRAAAAGGRLGTLLHMKAKPFAKRGDWGVCASIRVSEVPEAGRALSRQRPQLLLDRPAHYYLLWGTYILASDWSFAGGGA